MLWMYEMNDPSRVYCWLMHFMSLVSSCTPWKQKSSGCHLFSEGIERDEWHEMVNHFTEKAENVINPQSF